MAVNLKTEYSPLLDKRFIQKSLTEQWCGHDYNWDGDETIKVWTLGQVQIHDYWTNNSGYTANRFTGGNAPTELQDEINSYTLKNRKSFAATIDITNNQDQANIKKANSILKQVWDEQIVPLIDKDRLTTWATGAGSVTPGAALTKSTVIEAILNGTSALNNSLVNRDNRVCFVTESLAVKCKLASELQYNEAFTTKALVNGQIAKLNGMPIVSVPDDWMPTGVEFMIKYKRSSADPMKLKMLRSNNNVPGLAGTLIEGLVRFDSFVLANKAMGIYVYGGTGAVHAAPSAATQSSGTLTITPAANSTKTFYTLDGSNPKTSDTAAEYDSSSKPTGVAAGTVVRTYSTRTGYLPSGIATFTV